MTTQRVLQNNRLLWVDGNVENGEKKTQDNVEQLKAIIYRVDVFSQIDDCVRFLEHITNEKALLITSGFFGQCLIQQIHHLPQIEAIYIYCVHPERHQTWTKEWSKIRGVHNDIKTIKEALRIAIKQTNEDLTPISFVTPSKGGKEQSTIDLNRLEPSFMYTNLFKRILLDMVHDSEEKQAIVKFCRAHYADNRTELNIVEEFNRDYRPDKAIWWYTRESFTYQMVNRALRLLESDIIIDMGFFIHDIHRQLEQLHQEQFSDYHGPPLTLYRGQALSTEDFSKLQKSRGGLIAFNSFLSTSKMKSISLDFARQCSTRDKMVGVLFVMSVDPTIHSAIFADIDQHSYFQMENEVLFSMHTVFCIGGVVCLDERQRLFEVQLTLTSEDDPALSQLTNQLEKDLADTNGWRRLGKMLLSMGQADKAEELYLVLLEQKPNEQDEGYYCHHLGAIKNQQGDYQEAAKYYERAIGIDEKILSPTDPTLATNYTGIGLVYCNIGEYSQALSHYHKAHIIFERTLPANHLLLATSFNNIGLVYNNMGNYPQALAYYEKTLAICETIFPDNHPNLATLYNNIGLVFSNKEDYSQALVYYNKAHAIYEKTLPSTHIALATFYNNIGLVYKKMDECSKALLYYNKAHGIYEKTIPATHPLFGTSYNNLGAIYFKLEEYSKAQSLFEKALEIRKNALPPGHTDIQSTLDWLASVKEKL